MEEHIGDGTENFCVKRGLRWLQQQSCRKLHPSRLRISYDKRDFHYDKTEKLRVGELIQRYIHFGMIIYYVCVS